MKIIIRPINRRPFFYCISCLIFFYACAKKIYFQDSELAPKANGKITWKNSGSNAYQVEIDAYYLKKPETLKPSKDDYVVWIQGVDDSIRNVGRMVSVNSLTSPVLEGELVVFTHVRPVKVFITAEDSTTAVVPGTMVVLTTPRF